MALSTRLPGTGNAYSKARALGAYPFTLGVASGDPLPDWVVLWTRLAPDPLDPGGGMPHTPVEVAWEVAHDEAFTRSSRRGSATAPPELAHSVHVDVGAGAGRSTPTASRRAASAARSAAPEPRPEARRDEFAFVSCQPGTPATTPPTVTWRRRTSISSCTSATTSMSRADPVGGPRTTPIPALGAGPDREPRPVPAALRPLQDRPGPAGGARRCSRWSSPGTTTRSRTTTPATTSADGDGRGRSWRAGRTPTTRTTSTCRCAGGSPRARTAALPPPRLRRPGRVQRARHPPVPHRPGRRRPRAATGAHDPRRRAGGVAAGRPGLGAHWNVIAQQVMMAQLDADPGPGVATPNELGRLRGHPRPVSTSSRRISRPTPWC